MYSSVVAALACLGLVDFSSAGIGSNGPMGQTSSASISIRASVAPRVWRPDARTLCVASGGPYSMRLEPGSAFVQVLAVESGSCPFGGQTLRLKESGGLTTLVIIPD
jgi:hypothetical protein